MSENILENIPNRTNNTVYCLYTEYEGDHTQPYDVVLGCKVSNTNNIPDGFTHLHVPESSNEQSLAKGVIEHGQAVVDTWMQIWQSDFDRAYSIDYEVYDERAENLQNAEVDIFIALK
ncbi:MAG: putative transcriptional regulator YdeE [Saprospiraceae bacterium]|jgi:predicted transcriptional regulator YdeE